MIYKVLTAATALVGLVSATSDATKFNKSPHFKSASQMIADNNKHLKIATPKAEVQHSSLRVDGRALAKDNFINIDVYSDVFDGSSTCNGNVIQSFGYLLNYCFALVSGESYAIKTNTNDGTLVQLDYGNDHCNGVPKHVTDLFKMVGATGYDMCGYGQLISYSNARPDSYYTDAIAMTYSTPDDCEAGDNFYAYITFATDVCYDSESTPFQFSIADCDTTGNGQTLYYEDDSACMGDVIASDDLPTTFCIDGDDSIDDSITLSTSFEDAMVHFWCLYGDV